MKTIDIDENSVFANTPRPALRHELASLEALRTTEVTNVHKYGRKTASINLQKTVVL